MKKIGILLLILCYFVCSVPVYSYAQEAQSTVESTEVAPTIPDGNSSVISGSHSLDALNPLLGSEKLVDNVRSAIVYEANSQTMMYAWNPDEQMYPASLVKIMTALLAVEKCALDEIVTVSKSAIDSVPADAVSAKLQADEKMSLNDLLHCLLVGSANDAAAVIAEHISGSQSAFVDLMNLRAQELGCNATVFKNAHGLHDDNQHTTARDSAKILEAAINNSVFKTIFTTDEYVVNATGISTDRKFVTNNTMKDSTSKLYYDARVIGGRTGVAKDGRRCIASAAESNGMLVITVVMGSESVYQEDGYSAISVGGFKETTALLDACLTGYKTAQILRAEQVLRQIPVEGAQNDLLIGAHVSVSTVLPENTAYENLTFTYSDMQLALPIQKGQHVSNVQIWSGGMCVAQAELYALNELRSVNDGKGVTPSDLDNSVPIAIWIVLGVTLLIVIVFVLIRFSRKIRMFFRYLRRKRYRRSRKRAR